MNFENCFAALIGNEGVLSMDPNDRGNWTGGKIGVGVLRGTKYGVSAAAHPTLDIPNLTLDQARRIYYVDYWGPAGCDVVPDGLKFDLFDFAVNSGPKRAAKLLQRSVGAEEDGAIGPRSLLAIANMNVYQIRLRLTAHRGLLMAGDPAFSTQGKGWMNRLAHNALRG